MPELVIQHLHLVAGGQPMARAMAADRAALEKMLGARVPPEWPPELLDSGALDWFIRQSASENVDGWLLWAIVLLEPRTLIGSAGFKGPPQADGRVDIGYGVLEPWRCRGYATETVAALVAWAFQDVRVEYVIGETLPELQPSIRVLEKAGFTYIGVGPGHEGEPAVLRYRLTRADYTARPSPATQT